MKVFFIAAIWILGASGFSLKKTFDKVVQTFNKNCPIADDQKCPKPEITFFLYTKAHRNGMQVNTDSAGKAPWGKGALKLYVHGYDNNHTGQSPQSVVRAYLNYGDYNVVLVDWSGLCKKICYLQAVQSLKTAGACVAAFVSAATRAHKFDSVHLMGHSLGAHVVAHASAIVKPHRLTKFDPALPLIRARPKGVARFIDVYHTNCEIAGEMNPSGTVDVYFNTDVFQPGCKCDITCSHIRSVEYFLESIGKQVKAFPCKSWRHYADKKCKVPIPRQLINVGEGIDTKSKGTYMVFTSSKSPFLTTKSEQYTNQKSFFGFQKALEDQECKVSGYVSLVKDWING